MGEGLNVVKSPGILTEFSHFSEGLDSQTGRLDSAVSLA